MFLKPLNSNTLQAEYMLLSGNLQRKAGQFAALALSFLYKMNTLFLGVFSGKPLFFVLDKISNREFFHEFLSFIVSPRNRGRAAAHRGAWLAKFCVPFAIPFVFVRVPPHPAEVHLG